MKRKLRTEQKYLNPISQLFLGAQQLMRVLIAGRGFSKSFGNGIDVAKKVEVLPRSKGLFLGVTYTQILTNTLLPMKSAWEQYFGYVEGVHYVVGKKPPEWFDKPYQRPERYENVVTFWNGTTIVFGSFDRPQLLRGASYDWVITDEALLIKKDQYDQIVIPSIRPTHPVFLGKAFHRQQSFTSSMPYSALGSWLLDMEVKSKQHPNEYFYIEGTSWHNRYILGDDTILGWRREMSEIQYLVEVMNKRIKKFGALFYPSLQEGHWYTDSFQYDHIEEIGGLGAKALQQDCRWDKDLEPNLALNISHDWGAFNCITIDQETKVENRDEVKFINAMHVYHPLIIDDLAKMFCDYYKHHKTKLVYQWGDKSGNNKVGNSKLTNFEQFAEKLRDEGWRVIRKKVGDVEHIERHRFINNLHREQDTRLPRIRYNANRCKDMRISLESAGMKLDKKDKSSEVNPSVKPEHATHYTDAHDYRLYHGLIHRQRSGGQAYDNSFVV